MIIWLNLMKWHVIYTQRGFVTKKKIVFALFQDQKARHKFVVLLKIGD